jgi:putative transposase
VGPNAGLTARAKRFYLLVALSMETPDPLPADIPPVLGIALGQRYLAVLTTPDNHPPFYARRARGRATADHYARIQKRLQRQGTRSATRRRLARSLRARRLKLSHQHTSAKQLLDTHPKRFLGLQDVTGIRERVKRQRGNQATKKQRCVNRQASKWALAELRELLT